MTDETIKQVTDQLQVRIDGLQEQLNSLRAGEVDRVAVGYFPSGTQGQIRPIATVLRRVREGSAIFPVVRMCASYPLEERTFHWIELAGKRWPVTKNGDGDWYLYASKSGFSEKERELLAAENVG